MVMVSDCANHIYEALRCFEKAKVIPGFNPLRKPVLDNLMYFTWIVADEDGFHTAFTSGDPTKITQKVLGNRRRELMQAAVEKVGLSEVVRTEDLHSMIFESRSRPHRRISTSSSAALQIMPRFQCADCKTRLKVTESNAAKLILADCFQCTACRRKQLFPLSWMF